MLNAAVYKDGSNACSNRSANKFVCKSNAEKKENITLSTTAQLNTIIEKMYVPTLISLLVSLAKYPAVKPASVFDNMELPSKLPVIRSIKSPYPAPSKVPYNWPLVIE